MRRRSRYIHVLPHMKEDMYDGKRKHDAPAAEL